MPLDFPFPADFWTQLIGSDQPLDLLESHFPIVNELKGCPQDPIFHAEGDVYIHTNLVLKALFELEEWKALALEQQQLLALAALFHDIAKPACTVEIKGRISAPYHAKKGAVKTNAYLYKSDLGLPFSIRRQVVQLVKYHGLPLWFWDKENPDKSIISTSLSTPIDLLFLLAKADVLGRICDDQKELLDRVELFALQAKELKCFDQAFEFPSPLSKIYYLKKEEASPLFAPFDDKSCEVTVLMGLPGSGKDTWIKQNAQDLPMVSLDEIRRAMNVSPKDNQGKVIQSAKEAARVHLRAKSDFIWNATNLTKLLRQKVIRLFRDYNAKIKLVYLETTYQELIRRNQNREYPVPQKVLEKMISGLELAEEAEVEELHYFRKVD